MSALRVVPACLLLAAVACQAAPAASPSPAPSNAQPAAVASSAPAQAAGVQPSPSAQTGSLSPEAQRLVAAAKANGETDLNLSWSQDLLGGTDGASQFQDLMNQMYGLNVKISFTPGPSMTNMAGKVAQEAAAGQPASTDVFVGSELHYSTLYSANALESYDYTQLSPRITQQFLAPNNIGVEYASRFPDITYNSNLVSPADVPHTLQDVLNPRWNGKIASNVDAAGFDRIALLPNWGADNLKAYLTSLSKEVSGLIRCGEYDRLASGEFEMLVMDCGTYSARAYAAKGAPIAGVIPLDAAVEAFWYLGVPNTSAHPDLAKLYVNAVMSEAGQRLLYKVNYTDDADLPGSQSAPELADLRAQNVQPERVDVQFVLDHPELPQLTQESIDILRQGSGS